MNLIYRAKNMLLTPYDEWVQVANEQPDTHDIIKGYVLPLLCAVAVATFIGYSFIGLDNGYLHRQGIGLGLTYAIEILVVTCFSIYLSALIIDTLAPFFDAEKNFSRSLQLVAYSYTPTLVFGLLNIFPTLSLISSFVSFYSFYLLYIGMPKIKETPPQKLTSYFAVTLVVFFVMYIIIALIMSRLLASVYPSSRY